MNMKKTLSITKNGLFRRLYSKGKSAAYFDMVVYTMKNGAGQNRLGITASTKIGCAVVRNRIRRRIREAYRSIEDNVLPGVNIVVVARSSIKDRPMPLVRDSLRKLLKKVDVWVD
ncbi:MAG: ribonuclease P protein component [Bacillota bacterium]|nr:ribonuclease P protein component [Bacillota bacterium]